MSTKTLKYIIVCLLVTNLYTVGMVFADKLSPASGMSSGPSTSMVTLEDIYRKTQKFDYTPSPHDLSTTSKPSASMHTLQDIWDSMMSIEISSGCTITNTQSGFELSE